MVAAKVVQGSGDGNEEWITARHSGIYIPHGRAEISAGGVDKFNGLSGGMRALA